MSLSDDYMFVVAIDFGTTYSGYAFSTKEEFETDPLKIHSNQAWNAGCQRHISMKTPTCLLLDDHEELVSFGYEAENKYAQIVIDHTENEYLFFQRFKMQLYKNENIKSEMIIEDVTGKSVPAMKVFASSVKALMNDMFRTIRERGQEIAPKEIRWVLTVPAVWSDAAKQLMRKSANLAGIKDEQLLIALEPEAASIYCQYLPTEKLAGAERGFTMFAQGTQYMVVDNGGGTTDITVHEKLSNGKLKELCRASGGDCGGTSVDNAFFQMFVRLVGAPLLNAMKEEDPSAYLDIFREFDAIKRTVERSKEDKVIMTIPRTIIDAICKKYLDEDLLEILTSSAYKDRIDLHYDKMRIDANIIADFFKEASTEITNLIADALQKTDSSSLSMIVLVGGFSACKIVQETIKGKFPDKRVIVPEDAGLSVLKGAVLFGHRPDYIISRIARYTYGVGITSPFDDKIHDDKRRAKIGGEWRCKNLFKLYIKKGSTVELGSQITGRHQTIQEFQRSVSFPVFQSVSENPKYTDEKGCRQLGILRIEIPDPSKKKRTLCVNLIFGNTELKVRAFDVNSGAECTTILDLL